MDLTIREIVATTVNVPFREVPARNMARELPHWSYFEIVEVRLRGGSTGFGETMLYYTWGATTDQDIERAFGRNAAELMWDDSLGAGLQMALFDAVGRAAGVPIHRLLGSKLRDQVPVSWWAIDMPGEDWVSEASEALALGYTSFKTKGRPWWDVREQVETLCRAAPDTFRIDLDFNGTLLDAERGIPILKDLERHPQVAIYETPIPQEDVAGSVEIRKAVRAPIAMHYGIPAPMIALREDVCDGLVVGGGASEVMEQGSVAAMADKPFWLQLVGTGLTACFSLHFGAVLSHARWPAVNCHQLFTHQLLAEPIRVEDGRVSIPGGPGLGYEVDMDAIERFRVEKPETQPDPPRLVEASWPDGMRMYYATGRQLCDDGKAGKLPFFSPGGSARLAPDDGSPKWRQLRQQVLSGPVALGDK